MLYLKSMCAFYFCFIGGQRDYGFEDVYTANSVITNNGHASVSI